MTTFLIFSADVAGVVRGPSASTPGASLEPVALTDGRCILSAEVLQDPAHAAHHDILSACSRVELEDISDLFPVDDV